MKKVLISIICICSLLMLTACGKNNLEGTWYYFDGSAIRNNMYYKFNDDKTGEYVFIGGKNSFIYETKDGKVTLNYIGGNNSSEYEYKIENDTLTIKDSLGSDIVYKKSK